MGAIQNKIAQSQQQLQDRADQYTQNYKQQYDQYNLGQDTLGKAISGDQGAYGQTSDLLQRGMAGPVENRFEGVEDLYVQDMDLLKNKAGLQKLASQGQDPRYSEGMSAFDVMLMQRDPRFTGMVAEMQGQNRALEENLGEQPAQLREQAAEYGEQSLAGGQQAARDYLQSQQGALEAQNQAEADAYREQLSGLDRAKIGREQGGQVFGDVEKELLQQYGERAREQIEQARGSYDPGDFMSFDEGQNYSMRDFFDQGEADRMNRIMGLSGQGGEAAYSAAQGPGEQYSVDRAGLYNRLVGDISGARDARDIEQQALLQQIEGDAAARAAQMNEARAAERAAYGGQRQDATERILASNPELAGFYNQAMQDEFAMNPERSPELSGQDIYSQQEADRMNEILADLTGRDISSDDNRVMAGGYQGRNPLFQEAGYRDFLENKLNQARTGSLEEARNRIMDAQASVRQEPERDVRDTAFDPGTYRKRALERLTPSSRYL